MALTGAVFPLLAAALNATVLGEYPREDVPEGLSGITRRAADRYFCVDDSGGSVFDYRLTLDEKGEIAVCENLGSFKLDGRVDLEGCAWDPLADRLWVSDERDHSVRAFAPTGGCALSVLDLPKDVVGKFRLNRSLEALSISPDGLTLWTANEDTLEGDGPVSSRAKGGVVRLMRFTRPDGKTPWRFDRFFRYETDPVAGEPFQGHAVSGVPALCACADGSLLVLEREFSAKQPFDATFRARLYRVSAAALAAGRADKTLLWGDDTGSNNYEGMCLGPKLADGRQTLVLVSDGDGEAGEYFMTLSLQANETTRKVFHR